MTTAELIAELERLDKEATPGPWRHYHDKLRPQFRTVIDEVQAARGKAVVAWGGFDAADTSHRRRKHDAALIAKVRTRLPGILAALRRLEEVEQRAEKADELDRRTHVETLYRDIFAEITAKVTPLTTDPNDPERIMSYAIPAGPIHRAAGKAGFQMFGGEEAIKQWRERAEKAERERNDAIEERDELQRVANNLDAGLHKAFEAKRSTERDLAAAREALKPRPIETAPKDGTHIVVINKRYPIHPPTVVHWFDDGVPKYREDNTVVTGSWYLSVNRDERFALYSHFGGMPVFWWPVPQDLLAALATTEPNHD